MIPVIIAGLAGAAVGAAAHSILSDDKPKTKIIRVERERLSENEVPEDVKRQVEGTARENSYNTSRSNSKYTRNAEEIYQQAHDYYYGRNGCRKDIGKAIELYSQAADMGYNGARKLKEFWNLPVKIFLTFSDS